MSDKKLEFAGGAAAEIERLLLEKSVLLADLYRANERTKDYKRRLETEFEHTAGRTQHISELESERDALRTKLAKAQEIIKRVAYPLEYFAAGAKEKHDGRMASLITNDAGWLRREARRALDALEGKP